MSSQFIVTYSNPAEKAQVITALRAAGYSNPTEGEAEPSNTVPAFVVDTRKKWYCSACATVCAAWSQSGQKFCNPESLRGMLK